MSFPLRVRAVAYDLDGTLVDSVGDLAFATNLMREELSLEPIPESEIKTYIGKGIGNLVRRAVMRGRDPADDVSDPYVANALAICERHYAQVMCRTTRPYARAIDGLEAAREKGFRLAVITNKAARFTENMLQQLDLAKYFDLVLSGDSLPKKKPDPDPLLHAAKFFGVPAREMLMVGDSENDVEAAHNAGCPSFFVPYGYFQGGDVNSLKPTAIVADLVEAANLIENSALEKSAINL